MKYFISYLLKSISTYFNRITTNCSFENNLIDIYIPKKNMESNSRDESSASTPSNESIYSLDDVSIESQKNVIMAGPNKGDIRTTTTLFFGPYRYRKRKIKRNGDLLMTCAMCEKIANRVCATANLVKNGPTYELIEMPSMSTHVCMPSVSTNKVELAIRAMKKEVQKNPLKPIREIYENQRKET